MSSAKVARDMTATKRLAKARPGRPRDPAADAAVLRAALELFIEGGIEGANFDQIAKRSGVARTTIYRRWSSREDLLADAMETFRAKPERWLARINRVAPAELTTWVVDALAETVTSRDYRKMVARLVGSVTDSPQLMALYWNNYVLPRRKMVSEVMERARAMGLLPKHADPEVMQDMIGGAIMYHLLIRPGHRTAAQLRRYIRDVLRQLGIALDLEP